MNKITKTGIVVVLILAVGAVISIKENNSADSESRALENPAENAIAEETRAVETDKAEEAKALPRLVDLGADKCIPCKMMKPILDELKQEYKEQFKVIFIDVWKNPDEQKKYGIRMIPTQIFFDTSGKELFRHEGFFSRKGILAKWKELGVDIEKKKK